MQKAFAVEGGVRTRTELRRGSSSPALRDGGY